MTGGPPITRVRPAAWVRTADALTVALLLLAGSVAHSGGFRVWVGSWRVSVTSPVRLLLAALLLASIRHWFVRRPAISLSDSDGRRGSAGPKRCGRCGRSRLRGARASRPWGLLAVFLVGYPQGEPRVQSVEKRTDQSAGAVGRRMVHHHRADRVPLGPGSRGQQNIAFFPAYPMLMRVGGRLLGGSTAQVVLAGVLVSYAAFLGALIYLFKLARAHPALGSSDRAAAAVLLLGSYPFAVFYGALYTEALFLCATVGAFWHMRQQQLWRVAGWGLLAGLTRPNGLFLCVPLALMAVTDAMRLDAETARAFARLFARCWRSRTGLGVLLYSVFIYQLTGNPFQWAAIQVRWGRTSGVAWQSLGGRSGTWRSTGFTRYLRAEAPNFLNLTAAAFAAVLIWPVTRRLGVAYGALVAINLGSARARRRDLHRALHRDDVSAVPVARGSHSGAPAGHVGARVRPRPGIDGRPVLHMAPPY